MKYLFPIALTLALLIVGGAYLMRQDSIASRATTPTSVTSTASSSPAGDTASAATPPSTPGDPATASGYTLAEVAKHGSAQSCWTVVNGSVYDVTKWIGQHPGGAQAILSMCGHDGSAAFNGQHGGQRRPQSELASFYLGALI